MSQPNKFAAALNKGGSETPVEAPGAAVADPPAPATPETPKTAEKPSRRQSKHIGGYFDPAVSRQLRRIALDEDSTIQDLLAEAMDMLFQSRQEPTIARRPVQD